MYCCISGCTNNTSKKLFKSNGVKFYYFPRKSIHMPWICEKRQKWINAVRKHTKHSDDWLQTRNITICSAHFIGNKKSENPTDPSYVPTIFPGEENNPQKLGKKLQRFERYQRRKQAKFVKLNTVENSFQEFISEESIREFDSGSEADLVHEDDAYSRETSSDALSATEDCYIKTENPSEDSENILLYDAPSPVDVKPDKNELLFEAFTCNECNRKITGFRYTCVQCNDLYLCGACELDRLHPHHYMLRVPEPNTKVEVETVLTVIRRHLLKDLDPIKELENTSISVKCERLEEESEVPPKSTDEDKSDYNESPASPTSPDPDNSTVQSWRAPIPFTAMESEESKIERERRERERKTTTVADMAVPSCSGLQANNNSRKRAFVSVNHLDDDDDDDDDARKAAEDSEYESSTEKPLGRGLRSKRFAVAASAASKNNKISHSSDEDANDRTIKKVSQMPAMPTIPAIENQIKIPFIAKISSSVRQMNETSDELLVTNDEHFEDESRTTGVGCNKNNENDVPSNLENSDDDNNPFVVVNAKLNVCLRLLGALTGDVKCLKQRMPVNNCGNAFDVYSETTLQIKKDLPLKTRAEVNAFDEKLLNSQDYRQQFVKTVYQIGGANGKDYTERVLNAIFSQSFATDNTWEGKKTNYKVNKLNLIKICEEVILEKFPNWSSAEFSKAGNNWFRLGNQRAGYQPKQVEKKNKATNDSNTEK